MCKKQTSVSHGSTESGVGSLDAGLCMDGLPALHLWDIVIEVLRSTNNNVQPKHTSQQENDSTFNSKPRPRKSKEDRKLMNSVM